MEEVGASLEKGRGAHHPAGLLSRRSQTWISFGRGHQSGQDHRGESEQCKEDGQDTRLHTKVRNYFCVPWATFQMFFKGRHSIGLYHFIYYFSIHTSYYKDKELNQQKCPEQDVNCRP